MDSAAAAAAAEEEEGKRKQKQMQMQNQQRKGSRGCSTAGETQEWIHDILDFIRPYAFLIDAHVVNFFKDRLWEGIDGEWIDCLRQEPVQNLLTIPSGILQEHWPTSLKDFITTIRSLVFPRKQADLHKIYPDLMMCSLDNVLMQGMNEKKIHEVKVLSAVVSSVARSVGSQTVVDVGAGQGYLAQVLSFQHQLSVLAIDASSHHGKVTNARAQRIKKHYVAKMQKSLYGSTGGSCNLDGPAIVTCRLLSSDSLYSLSGYLLKNDEAQQPKLNGQCSGKPSYEDNDVRKLPSLLLAGLHACGDLSATMLRTFAECKEVNAVISIGCCYNLLSEEGFRNIGSKCGFPMSKDVKSNGLLLGKSALDLACQSAERWRNLGKDDALHNFELHAFRAAFQMLLCRYYPEALMKSPTIGRLGKTMRRRQRRRNVESSICERESKERFPCRSLTESTAEEGSTEDAGTSIHEAFLSQSSRFEGRWSIDRFSNFNKFCQSGLCRLGLQPLQDIDFLETWQENEPFIELIGPYWSLRAALGPVVETLLLLDRLLFIQEQGDSLQAIILPIFDPSVSPRNVAIIAIKN